MSSAAACFFAGLTLLLLSSPCSAQASHLVKLTWRAPAECPQELKVSQKLRALLGTQPADAPQSRLRAEGSVEPVSGRFRLTLDIHYDAVNGTRVVEANACEDLAGVAAVTLALLIHVEQSSGTPLTAGELGGSTPAQSRVMGADEKRSATTAADSASLPRERWRFALRAPVLRSDIGVLPTLAFGIGLGTGARYKGFRLFASGTLWLPQNESSTEFLGYGAHFGRVSAELLGCHAWQVAERLELAPCALLAFDDVSARGIGADLTPTTQHAAWLSPGLGLEAEWAWSRRALLVLGVNGRFATSKPRFVSDGVGELHRVWPAAFGVILGCEWIL